MGNRVRLREAPNTKANILGHFDRRQELEVMERYFSGNEKHPWFKVSSGDNSGWMYGEFLRMTED
jgi:hypothetical protein